MRRLVLAAIAIFGAAIIVSAAAAAPVNIVDPIDPTSKGVKTTVDKTPPLVSDIKSTGIMALTLAPGTTAISDLVDLSQYSSATLILSWGTSVAADSDSVNIAVRIYNKETGAWGSDDVPVAPLIFTPGTALDTLVTGNALAPLLAQNANSGTRVPRPNLYIYRNGSTMLKATGSAVPLYGLGSVRRAWAPNGGIAVDLTSLCGSMKWSYWGAQFSNWANTTSLTNFKAVLWVSR